MLDFQLVQAPFRFGVDEGNDPKQVPFGTLLTAQNVVWLKSGRLQKRFGVSAISSSIVGGGSLSSAERLIVRGDELALVDGTNLYSYTASGWVNKGEVPEAGIEWSTWLDDVRGVRSFDVARLSNGQIVQAWVDGSPTDILADGGLSYRILDGTTGAVVSGPTSLSTDAGYKIRVLASGTDWVILWNEGGDLKAATSGGTTTLQTDAETIVRYMGLDACVIGSEFVVAYALSGAGVQLRRYSFASTPALQASDTITGETAVLVGSISIAGASGETLYIAYSDGSNSRVRFAAADPSTLAQTVAPTTVETGGLINVTLGTVRTSASTCMVLYSYQSTTQAGGVMKSASITNAGTVTTGATSYMTRLLCRPFALNSRYYVLASTFINTEAVTEATSGETFLIEASLDTSTYSAVREVGKVDWLVGGYWVAGFASEVLSVSSTQVILPSPFTAEAPATSRRRLPNQMGVIIRQGARNVSVTVGASMPEDMWRSVSIGQETYFAAGTLASYDGAEVLGYGWSHPLYVDVDSTAASTSGGFMASGDYIYNVSGERRSAVGVLHRAPSGIPFSVEVTGPTASVSLAVVPLSIGASTIQPGLIPLFRTVVDGTVPQRLTMDPVEGLLYNAPTSQPLTFTDGSPDTDIAPNISAIVPLSSRPALYTQGGELEDTQPPSMVTVNLYRSRLFGILGDRHTVAFSKNHDSNPGVAPGFHPQQSFYFNDRLRGLAVLDERQFAFSEMGIYYFAGDGPAPNGDDSDYGTPQKLQTDVGCTNARGLVSTPMGIMFVAGTYPNTEIHLLDRQLSVQWVGKRVQDLLDAYPKVTSAVLVSEHNQVRFSCQADDGLTGIVIVYDYTENQWSHFVYGDSLPIADATMFRGVYTFATTSGAVYQEDSTTYLDAGSWVTAKLETAWIHANGPISYQAIRNFQIDGISVTAHGLSVSVGFDGNETYQQGPSAVAEGVSGVTSPGLQRVRVSIGTRRKCGSIRFKVEDSEPDTLGTGQGAIWSSMGIEAGVNSGTRRLPATQAR